MAIRSMTAADVGTVIALWNRCLPHDAVSPAQFGQRVLYDINFDPELFWVHEEAENLTGFCYATLRRVPDEISGLEAGKGYLVALGVDPEHRRQGIGRALVQAAQEALRARGVTRIDVCSYATNYFCPGVDKEGYPAGEAFLSAQGYKTRGESVSMAKALHGFVYPEAYRRKRADLVAQGYRFGAYTPADALPLLAFLRAEFVHWLPNLRQALAEGRGEDTLLVAYEPGGQMVGFVLRAMDGCPERFGPFGVSASMQGKGIGTILFHDMMQDMVARHIFYTHFLWTGGRNLDIYGTWGMHIYRRYAMMGTELDPQ